MKYIIESLGAGCAFFDYDNDGWMYIFIVGGRLLEGKPVGSCNRLYRNNRDGTFTDVTVKAGLADAGWGCGVCVGDYNNDGLEDLFVSYYGQNKLYRNNGDGTFTDVTAKAGLLRAETRFSPGCTWIDYDRNALLNLFVANYGYGPQAAGFLAELDRVVLTDFLQTEPLALPTSSTRSMITSRLRSHTRARPGPTPASNHCEVCHTLRRRRTWHRSYLRHAPLRGSSY